MSNIWHFGTKFTICEYNTIFTIVLYGDIKIILQQYLFQFGMSIKKIHFS